MHVVLDTFPIAASVLGSFILLLPFVVIEFINRQSFKEGFPFAIYIFTFFLQTAFFYTFLSLIRSIRVTPSLKTNPVTLVLRIVGLIVLVYIWVGWIVDQWPCMMGVPNCD